MPATPEASLPDPSPSPSLALHWLMPLHFFYEKRGLSLPPFSFVPGPSLPPPQRTLLVHECDMTPTLTAHHGSPLKLEVLDLVPGKDYLLRLVILRRQDNLRPVECGAIGIHLHRFSPQARRLIEEGQIPLGAILDLESVPHRGCPRGFFHVQADELIAHALGDPLHSTLFGRCNELSFDDGETFADVVEILPSSV